MDAFEGIRRCHHFGFNEPFRRWIQLRPFRPLWPWRFWRWAGRGHLCTTLVTSLWLRMLIWKDSKLDTGLLVPIWKLVKRKPPCWPPVATRKRLMQQILMKLKIDFRDQQDKPWHVWTRTCRTTAYHEAGHALVGLVRSGHQLCVRQTSLSHVVTGYALMTPKNDRYNLRYSNQLAGLMGGRAAEMFMFNEASSGASNDFNKRLTCSNGHSL